MALLPISIIIAIVNYKVDPANIFTEEAYIDGIAKIIINRHNVSNISNYDERLLLKKIVSNLKFQPDRVILGSSRIMEIGSDFYPTDTVINCGVSHANIYDITALCGILAENKRLPKKLLINLDPFTLSDKVTNEWLSIASDYKFMLNNMQFSNQTEDKSDNLFNDKRFKSILSFSYFKESLNFIVNRNSKMYLDIGRSIPYPNGRFFDGTISYSKAYTNPDTLAFETIAKEYAVKNSNGNLDNEKVIILDKLIDYLISKNIIVEFVMIPFHPFYYTTLNSYHKNELIEYEKFYINFASKKGIKILGSFNPSKYGLINSNFYDAFHPSKQAIKKIFN